MSEQHATVLAAEISGLEDLTPSDAGRVMKEVFDLVGLQADLYKGRIFLVNGSNFMAVFTDPDHAILALKFAEGIRGKLEVFDGEQDRSYGLGLKAGVETGPLLFNEIRTGGQVQPNVVGEPVKLAGRILDLAETGQILSGPTNQNYKKGRVQFQPLEPVPIKGRKDPLPVFEFKSVPKKPYKSGDLSGRKIRSEMVGRGAEYDLLLKRVLRLEEGQGAVINIIGKAGIGKTRLLSELKDEELMNSISFFEGRAQSEGKNSSYHPIIQITRSWAGITEEDSLTSSAAKLKQQIDRIMGDRSGEIYPFMAAMMGLPLEDKERIRVEGLEGDALKKLILRSLRDLLQKASSLRKIVIVIEDLHWADQTSVSLLESLYKLVRFNPVVFINIMRPGHKETGDRILNYVENNLRDYYLDLQIEPLDKNESEELISNFLGGQGLPGQTMHLVIQKAGGNPFFIEEVIRNFIDEGIVEVKGKQFIVTDRINSVNVPGTINEVVLSRIDKLDEKTKSLLKTASVIGQNFYYKVLQEATETIGELDEKLEYLKDVQLINEHKGKEEIEFLFKHALAQQATYDSILLKSRKELHLKIARSIEKVFAEKINEFYAVLSHHYTMAGHKEQTIKYLILAGDEAARSGASSEALQFYLDALDRMPEARKNDTMDELIRDLEIKVANAYYAVGKPQESVLRYEWVLKMYFNLRFPRNEYGLLFNALRSAALVMFAMKNQSLFFRKAMNDSMEVQSRLFNNWGFAVMHSTPRDFMLKGLFTLWHTVPYNIHQSVPALSFFIEASTVFSMTGLSLRTAERMIAFAERTDLRNNPQLITSYYFAVGMVDYFSGNWHRALDLEWILSTGLGLGRYPSTVSWLFYTGMIAVEDGSQTDFHDRVTKLDDLAETLDVSYAKVLKYRLLVLGYLKSRKLDEAFQAADQGVEYIKTTDHHVNLFTIYCLKAEVCVHIGKISLASSSLMEAEKILGRQKRIPLFETRFLLAKAHLLRYKIINSRRNDPSYRDTFREFIRISSRLIKKGEKVRAVQVDGYMQRARVYDHHGNQKKALGDYERALRIGEKLKSRPDLSRVYFEVGKFLLNPNARQQALNGLTGEDYLKKAKALFEELDFQWDLQRLEEYVDSR